MSRFTRWCSHYKTCLNSSVVRWITTQTIPFSKQMLNVKEAICQAINSLFHVLCHSRHLEIFSNSWTFCSLFFPLCNARAIWLNECSANTSFSCQRFTGTREGGEGKSRKGLWETRGWAALSGPRWQDSSHAAGPCDLFSASASRKGHLYVWLAALASIPHPCFTEWTDGLPLHTQEVWQMPHIGPEIHVCKHVLALTTGIVGGGSLTAALN